MDRNYGTVDERVTNRRRVLKTLGVGAGVAGFGGVASAGESVDEESAAVVGFEPLSDDRTAEEFQLAEDTEVVGSFTDLMIDRSLELQYGEVVGASLLTEGGVFDAHDPVVLEIPYAGHMADGFLHTALFTTDDGDRIVVPEGGISFEGDDEESVFTRYVFDGGEYVVDEVENIPAGYETIVPAWSTAGIPCRIIPNMDVQGKLATCYECPVDIVKWAIKWEFSHCETEPMPA